MLYYEETGNPEGPPVMFLHGYMSSNLQWELNRERLGEHLRMIMVEQPGHGRSSAPDEAAPYGREFVLNQFEELRTSLNLDRWWLVGHSLGGAMLIHYALGHPERINGLTFTNSRAAFGLTAPTKSDKSEIGDPPPSSDGNPSAPLLGALPTSEELRAVPFHPIHAKRFPPDLRSKLVDGVDAMSPHVFAHIATNRRGWRSRDDLHGMKVPTLLVNGRWEKLFQPCVEIARNAIADLRIVELEGGHSINIEQPDGFDRAVLEFIKPSA